VHTGGRLLGRIFQSAEDRQQRHGVSSRWTCPDADAIQRRERKGQSNNDRQADNGNGCHEVRLGGHQEHNSDGGRGSNLDARREQRVCSRSRSSGGGGPRCVATAVAIVGNRSMVIIPKGGNNNRATKPTAILDAPPQLTAIMYTPELKSVAMELGLSRRITSSRLSHSRLL
jgi:hypothetical protein